METFRFFQRSRLQFARGLAALESFFLVYFSVIPGSLMGGAGHAAIVWEGYLQHFLAYFLYGLLLSVSAASPGRKIALAAVVAGSGMGLFTETLQLFVPARFFDLLDWLADVLGVLAGSLLVYKMGLMRGGEEVKIPEQEAFPQQKA
jgi:hypothetical protein